MKRLWIGALAVVAVCVAVVLSGGRTGLRTFFPREERNPVTHLRWNDSTDEFRFAIVSDRTGGHRAEIFSQAVEKLNLMQPEFVICVGDLIEGGKKAPEKLEAEWKEFDGFVNKLSMPFFYAPGNHDVGTKETSKVWQDKLGRRYYHFVYRNVLFLFLNSDDPPGTTVNVGKDQIAYAERALKDNSKVRWTIVIVHRPLWTFSDGTKNGWSDIEAALRGRPYTVFCGHVHRFQKFVRQGMNYYQLATTGGASLVRGVEYGEFDQLAWVTMKKDGPVLANILLDSIHSENLQRVKTEEPVTPRFKQPPTYAVRGRAYFEGVPMAGAVVTLRGERGEGRGKGVSSYGTVEADGTFQLSTYKAFDGAPGGDYRVTFRWQEGGKSLLPEKYAGGQRATIKAEPTDVVLELKR